MTKSRKRRASSSSAQGAAGSIDSNQPMSAVGELYHIVLHFYARLMQLLDDGAIDH
jgi:hypothetical protein